MHPKKLGCLALLQLGLVLPAAAQTPARSLLRVHSSFAQARHGFRLADEDLFLATDRSIRSISTSVTNTSSVPPPWLQNAQVVTGSPAAFTTLTTLLADNRIGQLEPQDGPCSGAFPISQGDSGTVEVTWYSRGQRKTVFVVEVNGSSPPCSPEILHIVNGIAAYVRAAGGFTEIPTFQ